MRLTQVTVTLGNVFGRASAVLVNGPAVFTLTVSAPVQGDENFLIVLPEVPK